MKRWPDELCGGYQVAWDNGELVVTCQVCGPSRVSEAGARRLVDPLLGLLGPFGRFKAHASRAEREKLARLISEALAGAKT